ncbi:MAG: type II secretion system protein [Coprobacillus cateniformis]
MEKAFQLMMVKHMLTNRGFTLVETLFVLFIFVCSLCSQ